MKLTGFIFRNDFDDILLVLNEKPEIMWIPTREGKEISIEPRKRSDVEAWANRQSRQVKVIHEPRS